MGDVPLVAADLRQRACRQHQVNTLIIGRCCWQMDRGARVRRKRGGPGIDRQSHEGRATAWIARLVFGDRGDFRPRSRLRLQRPAQQGWPDHVGKGGHRVLVLQSTQGRFDAAVGRDGSAADALCADQRVRAKQLAVLTNSIVERACGLTLGATLCERSQESRWLPPDAQASLRDRLRAQGGN